MSIISTAEFLVAFYEKLPEYLMAQSATKANIKDYKRLKSFMQKIKNRLATLKDDVSQHAAREQKKFVDSTLALATEFMQAKKENEETLYQKEVIEYTLYVWSLYSSLPKTIQKYTLEGEKAKACDYYEVLELSESVISTPLNFAFYQKMFFEPFEKIRRAASVFHEKYVGLATPSAEEGMAFASSVAETMKKMCRDFTLIYTFADRVLQTSRHTFVHFMNTMPSVVFELLENPMTKKSEKELRSFIKHLEKQCKRFGWLELLNDELLLATPIAETTSLPTNTTLENIVNAEAVEVPRQENAEVAMEAEAIEETVDSIVEDSEETVQTADASTEETTVPAVEEIPSEEAPIASTTVETEGEEDFQVEITEESETAENATEENATDPIAE